jgi:asparagine synthase (glutamine-hydrolysing)
LDGKSFPWTKSLDIRRQLLSPEFLVPNPEQFVQSEIERTLSGVEYLETDTPKDRQMRQMVALNVYWFMQTLLDRKDRMSMRNGLEVRVPFCDRRLAQYAFNIPWEIKALHGREKGLMREAFKDILPDEIISRKKNPYPKTFDPEFFLAMKNAALGAMNGGRLVSKLVNREYFDFLLTCPSDGGTPFYGQLMRLPQVFAWIYQMDKIFSEYGVQLV